MSAHASPKAKRIVRRIIDDLTDRRGLRHEWDNIDVETRGEIEEKWTTIVDEELQP